MRRILSQVRALIPQFGICSLSFSDLRAECERRDICLYESPLEWLHGCAWSDPRGTRICLNRNLYPEAKLLAGWHELAHVLLHPIETSVLLSLGRWTNRNKWEAEADAVAVIAVLPFPPDDRAAETNLEWARYRLFQTYGV